MANHQLIRENIFWLFKKIVNEIFTMALITYLLFYLIEDFNNGFIINYFNLNILLIITIISGILMVLTVPEAEERKPEPIKTRNYIFIVVLGIMATALIYFGIKEIGKLALIIAPISGLIIILISILLFTDDNDKI